MSKEKPQIDNLFTLLSNIYATRVRAKDVSAFFLKLKSRRSSARRSFQVLIILGADFPFKLFFHQVDCTTEGIRRS